LATFVGIFREDHFDEVPLVVSAPAGEVQ